MLAAVFGLGPQAKKSRSVPAGAGNQDRDFGEIAVGIPVIDEPIRQHRDAVAPALPCPHKDRARLDPARQHDLAAWLRSICLHHLIEQALCRPGEAAVGLLLNSMRDAPSQEVWTECLRRINPNYISKPCAQRDE